MATDIVVAMKRDGITQEQAEQILRGFSIDVIRRGVIIARWARSGTWIVRETRDYGVSLEIRQFYDAQLGHELPF